MSRDQYSEYRASEPYYTPVPLHYYTDNINIPSNEYVKRKMNVSLLTTNVLLQACKTYPEIFCYYMLGIHLRPYQQYMFEMMDKHNHVAMACSRRIGKSTITKLYVLWTARFNKLAGNLTGTTWNIVLQDQDIANQLYIEPLHEMMEKGDKIVTKNFKGALGQYFFTSALVTKRDKFGKVKANQITLKTETGICRINTLPPTNKAIGREGNIIGDEVSKWKNNPKCRDEFKFYDQLIAIMKDNTKFKSIFLSTPEGDEDMFAKAIFDPNGTDPNNRYHKIWFPYAVRNEPAWLNEIRKTRDEAVHNTRIHIFMQEYEAKFITISNPFFNYSQVVPCVYDNIKQTHESGAACSLGIDWGGSQKSETALAIIKWDTNKKNPRKCIYLKTYPVGLDLIELEPDLHQIAKYFNIKWVIPDNKGGRWMIPKLENLFGRHRVQPLNFTTEKREGYERLRKAFIDKMIQVPNDVKLIKQIQQFSEELKPSSTKGQDDLIDALMLAAYPLFNKEHTAFRVVKY